MYNSASAIEHFIISFLAKNPPKPSKNTETRKHGNLETCVHFLRNFTRVHAKESWKPWELMENNKNLSNLLASVIGSLGFQRFYNPGKKTRKPHSITTMYENPENL